MNGQEMMEAIRQAASLPKLAAALREGGVEEAQQGWAVRYFLDMRAREKGLPLKGTFELTPLCNLDCKMCYVHLAPDQLNGAAQLGGDTWERLMGEAVDAGMLYACLTGGECLTYPEFDRLYLYLHQRGVQVSVLTNAVLLDAQRVDFFLQHPPVAIQATLYGADEAMYERVTGKRVFGRVITNLLHADQAGLPLSLTLTPSSYLGQDNEMLLHFAAGLGLPFQVNSGLIAPRAETGRSEQQHDVDVAEYMRLFRLQMKLKGSPPPPECAEDLPKAGGSTVDHPRGLRCGGGRSAFVIRWDGALLPCNRLQALAGYPLMEGFSAAWQKVNDAAEAYLLPLECEGCAFREGAKPCAAAHLEAAPGHADPQQCDWCRAMVKAGFAQLTG